MKNNQKNFTLLLMLVLSVLLSSCIQIPKTVEFDKNLSKTNINGYPFHTEIYGKNKQNTIIVVHGGPGGDLKYLKSLKKLEDEYHIVFYDQRGSGRSPRVAKEQLTLEQNLNDLNSIIEYFNNGKKVYLIGHSWGGMLAIGYISRNPEKISKAVIIEPGMLNQKAAIAFVKKMKKYQSFWDLFPMTGYIISSFFVKKEDDHESFDYVMTKLLNRGSPGPPYQCKDVSMPADSFTRAGYEAFNKMLKPVMDNPKNFQYNLTSGISKYKGDLMLISSECSVFGYEFQKKYHIPFLPKNTIHMYAENMGHNMITINPNWTVKTIRNFFNKK